MTEAWLPDDNRTTQVWTRGRHSSGWRLIDENLDGNTNPEPPHYDGLFYDNWARVVDFDPETGECLFESYTYRVRVNDDPPQWVWVPFDVGGDYRLQYSYVCCDPYGECTDPSVVAAGNEGEVGLHVAGSSIAQGGSVLLRLEMPSEGRVWLDICGGDGRLVRTLREGAQMAPGRTDLRWDLSDQDHRRLASGIYFVRLKGVLDGRAGSLSQTRVVVVR